MCSLTHFNLTSYQKNVLQIPAQWWLAGVYLFDPGSAADDDTHQEALCDCGIRIKQILTTRIFPDSTSKQAALNMGSNWFLNDEQTLNECTCHFNLCEMTQNNRFLQVLCFGYAFTWEANEHFLRNASTFSRLKEEQISVNGLKTTIIKWKRNVHTPLTDVCFKRKLTSFCSISKDNKSFYCLKYMYLDLKMFIYLSLKTKMCKQHSVPWIWIWRLSALISKLFKVVEGLIKT